VAPGIKTGGRKKRRRQQGDPRRSFRFWPADIPKKPLKNWHGSPPRPKASRLELPPFVNCSTEATASATQTNLHGQSEEHGPVGIKWME